MLQSILVLLCIVAALIFFVDIRRRARGHTLAVQKERDAIAALTHSTAIIASFIDESATEVLLGVSEDSGLFFYRRVDRGLLVLHYTLRLTSLKSIVLQINGLKRVFDSESAHMTAQMRATDASRQIRQTLSPAELAKIKHIRLNIFFKSEDGQEKHIPIVMYRAQQRGGTEMLAKSFENAVWWQLYLSQVSGRQSDKDTLTFSTPPRATEE